MNNHKPTPVVVGTIVTILVLFLCAKVAGLSSKEVAYWLAGVS
jgi:hypothetical protein